MTATASALEASLSKLMYGSVSYDKSTDKSTFVDVWSKQGSVYMYVIRS